MKLTIHLKKKTRLKSSAGCLVLLKLLLDLLVVPELRFFNEFNGGR